MCSGAGFSSFLWSSSGSVPSESSSEGGMRGLAMPVPGFRIGNSSSGEVKAFAEPGFRMGNSSSSMALGMGMGAEMVPRMDFGAGLGAGLARPEPDFQSVGIVACETGRGAKLRCATNEERSRRDKIGAGAVDKSGETHAPSGSWAGYLCRGDRGRRRMLSRAQAERVRRRRVVQRGYGALFNVSAMPSSTWPTCGSSPPPGVIGRVAGLLMESSLRIGCRGSASANGAAGRARQEGIQVHWAG